MLLKYNYHREGGRKTKTERDTKKERLVNTDREIWGGRK